MLGVLRWTRIIAVAVGILDLAVFTMWYHLKTFLLCQFATPVDSFLLFFKVLRSSLCIRTLGIPTTSV